MGPDHPEAKEITPWPEVGLETVSTCPVCAGSGRFTLHEGLADHVFRCAPGLWTLYRCVQCGAAYLDPRPTRATIGLAYQSYFTHRPTEPQAETRSSLSRQALKNGYLNRRFGYAFQPSHRAGPLVMALSPLHRHRCERVVRALPRKVGGRLLDVGCGNGAFLGLMRSQGWDAHGVDPDAAAVAVCRANGLPVHHGTVQDCGYPEDFFDAVTLNHVIEHLHDPVAVLRRCRELAAPGGRLWVETPNLGAVSHLAFRQHWSGLDPPRHLALFDQSALRRACEEAGFSMVRVSGTVGAFGMSAASRLVRRRAAGDAPASPTRIWTDGVSDLLFDLAGVLVASIGQNLVATAIKG